MIRYNQKETNKQLKQEREEMKMKIWMVMYNDYEETDVVAVFGSRDEAEKLMQEKGWDKSDRFNIQEWSLGEINEYYE